MTRDERTAISILNAYKVGYESGMEDYKQEPCEDVVSRKDVINAIDKWITEYKPQHYLIQSIRQLPSVTVRQCSLYSVSEDGRGLCALLEENPDDTPLAKERQNCEYRHENGNCLKVGGFCTAVDDKHCVKNERHTGKCKTCKHYLQGERDGSCDSYVCQHYSDWEEGAE